MNDYEMRKCALFGSLSLLENQISFIRLSLSDYDEITDRQINELHTLVDNFDFCLHYFKAIVNEN